VIFTGLFLFCGGEHGNISQIATSQKNLIKRRNILELPTHGTLKMRPFLCVFNCTTDVNDTPVYEAAYYYWYNRLKKLRKGKMANPEHEALFSEELKKFCAEGKRLKKLVQGRKMKIDDYNTWLAQQANLADDLMDKFAASTPK
jgi:hypothetical protein